MGHLVLDSILFLARQASAMPQPAPALLSAAGAAFTPFDEQDLERYFRDHPRRGDTSSEGTFVFLPMVVRHHLLPLLNVAYDLDRESLRLQLVVFVEEGIKQHGPRAFGYRYEPPEGAAGPHHFWHVQPVLELRLHDDTTKRLPGFTDDWRPADTPAFPLDAEEVLDLIVCLMVSLYGLREASLMQANAFNNQLGPRFASLRGKG